MHDITNRIATVLLDVEGTLRTHGKWDNSQPAVNALSSAEPFCMDTLSFEQWLQWILLPRMKTILEQEKPLPTKSRILTYAQAYLHKNDPPTTNLLMHIKLFDELITLHSRVKRH